MPEGDTVHLAATRLNAALGGRVLTRTEFRVPRYATSDLAGKTVREVVARGKHLLFRIDGGVTLHTHFKMEGSWHLYRHGTRWRGPAHQIRAVLENEEWVAVGFRLAVTELLDSENESEVVGHLGPDVLGPDWDPVEVEARMRARADESFADLLVDQRVIAGPGNVYRNEVCFLVGIHPATPVADVPDLRAAIDLTKRVMEANRATGNQVTTGDVREGRRHWVYGRGGQACRRCRTIVSRAVPSTWDGGRVTYWCSSCQPLPPERNEVSQPADGESLENEDGRKTLVIGDLLASARWKGSSSGALAWLGRLLREEGTNLAELDDPDLSRGTPVYVEADADVLTVQRVMAQHHIRLLPVVKDGEVLGVVDLVDLAMREDLDPTDPVGDAAGF